MTGFTGRKGLRGMSPGVVFFLKGAVLGFSIAAPVGPIGVLCIRRTLEGGLMRGFLSGMGAATADGLYGSLAAFGMTALSSLLLQNQFILRLFGGFFLLFLGFSSFKTVPTSPASGKEGRGILRDYVSVFFLTVANPMTILSFSAVFAGLGIGSAGGNVPLAGMMVLGVVSGSALWWLALSGSVSLLRGRFDPGSLKWVNRFSGCIIGCFGIMSVASLWV